MWLLLVFLILTAGRDQGNPCRLASELDLWICKTYVADNGIATKCSVQGHPECTYTVWEPKVSEPCENGSSRGGGVIPDKPTVPRFTWGVVKALYR